MSPLQGLLLGILQGLTEFLPVSSSGHLIILRELLGINLEGGLTFDAILQLATILAVFVYFRKDIVRLFRQDKKTLFAILLGTIPALVLGLLLEDLMDSLFRSVTLVALTLIAGSLLFMAAERVAFGIKSKSEITPKKGWWIGCFQTLALIPGISRSGATISGGLFLGLPRDAAARFSFLLSLPIITGSGLKKLIDLMRADAGESFDLPLALGFAAAFVVGLACIHWLLEFLKKHSLYTFVWYRLALAGVILVVQFI